MQSSNTGQERSARESVDDEHVRFTRRTLIGAAAAGSAALAGLRGASAHAAAAIASSSTPKRGGTLRVGMTGGASSDTLNPFILFTTPDYARMSNLYDYLVDFNQQSGPSMILAEEITSNADATEWTIRVRSGVTFHNGKDLTAEDVRYSLQQVVNPKQPGVGAALVRTMDARNIRVLDAHTVRIPFTRPYSTFVDTLLDYYFPVVPVGFNPRQPIGTGPFKYKSFTPGVQSTFVRNPDYWQSGLPYVDELVISEYPDETSQVNALLSGQVDMINFLTPPSITPIKSGGGTVTISRSGGWNPFLMRCDVAPFNDVRVRQAMRLLVDRPQLLETVFSGYGFVGNDLYAIWDPDYAHSLPQRHQDIEQAKFLLKRAGRENLTTTIVASPYAVGNVQAVEVLAQQAKRAGVTINIDQVTNTVWAGPNYTKWPFSISGWEYEPYFPCVASADLPGSAYGETHFYAASPRYVSLYNDALKTLDPAKRREIAYEMQSIYYDQSGYIIPVFPSIIDANASHVKGVLESNVGFAWWRFRFKQIWLA